MGAGFEGDGVGEREGGGLSGKREEGGLVKETHGTGTRNKDNKKEFERGDD